MDIFACANVHAEWIHVHKLKETYNGTSCLPFSVNQKHAGYPSASCCLIVAYCKYIVVLSVLSPCLGPGMTDALKTYSSCVSRLISVCHSYWFSKSLMLVKELITWIAAWLTPAPAAGFTSETSVFSQHSQLIIRNPFQSQPDWPATLRIMRN